MSLIVLGGGGMYAYNWHVTAVEQIKQQQLKFSDVIYQMFNHAWIRAMYILVLDACTKIWCGFSLNGIIRGPLICSNKFLTIEGYVFVRYMFNIDPKKRKIHVGSRNLDASYSTSLLLLAPFPAPPARCRWGTEECACATQWGRCWCTLWTCVGGENYELTATPKHPAKEAQGVECVGVVGKESNHHPILDDLLEAEHHWRSPREVVVSGREEELGEVNCGPPPWYRPHT